MRGISKRLGLAIAGVVIAIGSVAVVALAQTGADVGAPNGAGVKEPTDTQARSGGIESVVGAFAKPRSGDDELPEVARAEVASMTPPGTRPAESVKAASDGSTSLYLTPSDDAVCTSLVGRAGATVACSSRDAIERGSGRPSPSYEMTGCAVEPGHLSPVCKSAILYGVVPDGVERVSLGEADGVSAKVVNNAYLLEVPAGLEPQAIHYQ